MANYTGQSCIDDVVVILTGSTGFTTGQIVGGFPIGSGPAASQCYTILGSASLSETPTIQIQGLNVFTSCINCYKNQTVTAGTEYTVCVICCPCDSGSTVTSVAVPHPVWTSTDGKAVVQSNMVVLGGPNGLNS